MAAGGLRFHGSWSSIGWQTDKSPLDMARVTKSWEDAGFDYVPCGDTTFRECYVCLIAMALSTERVRLGTYVTNPSTRAPFVTVQTIASVDDASNDRAWLGIGLGDQRAQALHHGSRRGGLLHQCRAHRRRGGGRRRSGDVPGSRRA